MRFSLGGRAAEELIFGKVSTGASDDIQKVTDLAQKAITQYGMSETIGPVAFAENSARFLDNGSTRRPMSEEMAVAIDRQVKESIDKAYSIALDILKLNRNLLESTTQLLLEREVLEGDTLASILTKLHL